MRNHLRRKVIWKSKSQRKKVKTITIIARDHSNSNHKVEIVKKVVLDRVVEINKNYLLMIVIITIIRDQVNKSK